MDDALGLTETATACLQESRRGRNVQHQLVALVRQSVYSRLAGYEDTNDAERLAQDPAMRVIVGRRGLERQAASTNTMNRFETEVLTRKHNPEGLARMNAQWVDRAMAHTSHRRVILDMDSSKSPVHGEQEGAAYNGHFGCTCYHPIFVFNQFGDCEGAMLRPGNVHSAHNWREVLDPIVARYGRTGVRRYFRADAAFAKPEVYEYLEERPLRYQAPQQRGAAMGDRPSVESADRDHQDPQTTGLCLGRTDHPLGTPIDPASSPALALGGAVQPRPGPTASHSTPSLMASLQLTQRPRNLAPPRSARVPCCVSSRHPAHRNSRIGP